MVDFLVGYFHKIEKYPVCSHVEPCYLLKKILPDSHHINQPEPIQKNNWICGKGYMTLCQVQFFMLTYLVLEVGWNSMWNVKCLS